VAIHTRMPRYGSTGSVGPHCDPASAPRNSLIFKKTGYYTSR
jgi:hypothetical protein